MNAVQIREMIRSLFLSKSQRPYLAAMIIAAVLALYWDLHSGSAPDGPVHAESPASADTFIPDGFVLVPIEVQNFDSLDSILGKFGLVDLYQPSLRPGGKPFRVATKIKIMRAPLNPSHFAVLVPEAESAALVNSSTPFTVVVQRATRGSEKIGTRIEDPVDALELQRLAKLKNAKHPVKTVSRITIEVPNAETEPSRQD